jgi:hypothetical protein
MTVAIVLAPSLRRCAATMLEDISLEIHVMPPEFDESAPTTPFPKQTMEQLVAGEQRLADNVRRIGWARRLLIRFGFGLPEARNQRS